MGLPNAARIWDNRATRDCYDRCRCEHIAPDVPREIPPKRPPIEFLPSDSEEDSDTEVAEEALSQSLSEVQTFMDEWTV